MKSFTVLSFVLATILGLLQFGAETKAAASPILPQATSSGGYSGYAYAPQEPMYDYSYMQYSYPQPDMSQYYMQQYSMPQYSMPQYSMPQYSMPQYSIPQYAQQQYVPETAQIEQPAPSYTTPQEASELEGLSTQNAVVGKKNIQFKGFDVLGNLNLPINYASITDILG